MHAASGKLVATADEIGALVVSFRRYAHVALVANLDVLEGSHLQSFCRCQAVEVVHAEVGRRGHAIAVLLRAVDAEGDVVHVAQRRQVDPRPVAEVVVVGFVLRGVVSQIDLDGLGRVGSVVLAGDGELQVVAGLKGAVSAVAVCDGIDHPCGVGEVEAADDLTRGDGLDGHGGHH